jgi:hypothetical protein
MIDRNADINKIQSDDSRPISPSNIHPATQVEPELLGQK